MQAHEKEHILNDYLVRLFNEVERVEERSLADMPCKGLSLKELHVIEVTAACAEEGINSPTRIAQRLGITPGTLTTAVNLLVKKGCLVRAKDEKDGRSKRILVTDKGMLACKAHRQFHQAMVEAVLQTLTPEESDTFIDGLARVSEFFQKNTEKGF